MSNKQIILITFIAAFVVRLSAVILYSESSSTNSYEYGALAENLVNGKGYGLFYFEGDRLRFQYKEGESVFPSSYMMPLYPCFLASIFFITKTNSYFIVFLLQVLVSALTAVILFRFTVRLFNNVIGIISAVVYVFLPELIYPVISVGPTVFLHFLLVLLFCELLKIERLNKLSYLAGLLAVFIIYIRPSIVVFILLLVAYMIFKARYKQAVIITAFVILGLSPWVIRNYSVFDKFIPLTSSTGQNLYRGHNLVYPGYWAGVQEEEDIKTLKRDDNFELSMNDYYFSKGIKNVMEKPLDAIFSGFEKFYHLWVYYPFDERTGNLLYLVPWLLLLPFVWVSVLFKFDFKTKKYIYFYLLSSTLNSVLFFSLLRYQTIMKIAIIPLAAQGMLFIWSIYFEKNKTA